MDTVLIVAAFIIGAVEREDAINQLMRELASERRQTIEGFLAGEKRIGVLLAELKLTLISENDLLISTNAILDRISGRTDPHSGSNQFSNIAHLRHFKMLGSSHRVIGSRNEKLAGAGGFTDDEPIKTDIPRLKIHN